MTADYLAWSVLDRLSSTTVQLRARLVAYDENAKVVIGSKADAADVVPYSIVQNQSINLSDLSADKRNGLNLVAGSNNNDTLEGTSSPDLLLSLRGQDEIRPGKGADGIVLSEGVKTLVYRQGDSGPFSSNLLRVNDDSASLKLSTKDFDIISGLALLEPEPNSRTDYIDLPDGDYVKVTAPASPKLDGSIEALLSDLSYMQIRGNYDPLQDIFTLSNTGKSSLLLVDFGQSTEAIVLVGFIGLITDNDVTGKLSLTP
ncbi:MAG: hypothetical protein EB072_00540 [Betaproteobacteria bacterium]|nr:hypothetical protein [Betaproteobacteria bacterium]